MAKSLTLNEQQRQAIIVDHIPFAKRLARRFYHERRNIGMSLDDYEGAAMLGLCDASRRFEPSRGMAFQTFAYFRVRGAMYDLLRRGGGVSRRQFNKLLANEKGEGGAETGDTQLPFAFARSASDLAGLIDVIDEIGIKLHLNSDLDVGEISYSDELSPESAATLRNTREYLEKIICKLPERERVVIQRRYWHGHSFEQIRQEFGGVSKSWVSRLHTRALDALRESISTDELVCARRVESSNVEQRQ